MYIIFGRPIYTLKSIYKYWLNRYVPDTYIMSKLIQIYAQREFKIVGKRYFILTIEHIILISTHNNFRGLPLI